MRVSGVRAFMRRAVFHANLFAGWLRTTERMPHQCGILRLDKCITLTASGCRASSWRGLNGQVRCKTGTVPLL